MQITFFFLILWLNHLKSLDPIYRRIYGHGQNNRFDSIVYTHKQCSSFFFQSYTHQTNKEIQNKNVQQLTENTE